MAKISQAVLDRRKAAAIEELARVFLQLPKIKKDEEPMDPNEATAEVLRALAGPTFKTVAKLKQTIVDKAKEVTELQQELNTAKETISQLKSAEVEVEEPPIIAKYEERADETPSEEPLGVEISARDREKYEAELELVVEDWYFEADKCPYPLVDLLKLVQHFEIKHLRPFLFILATLRLFISEGLTYKEALKKLRKNWNDKCNNYANSNASALLGKMVFRLKKGDDAAFLQYGLELGQEVKEVENQWIG